MRSAILWALAAASTALAVKPEDFKTCAQSSFCRRLRGISRRYNEAPTTFTSPYSVSDPSAAGQGSWTWDVSSSLYTEIRFELKVDILQEGDGIVRVRMDEVGSSTQWRRYNETAKWALVDADPPLSSAASLVTKKGVTTISYGPPQSKLTLEVQHAPLRITQLRGGVPEVVLNDRSLLHMEHFRAKDEPTPENNDAVLSEMSESEQVVMQASQNPIQRGWFEETDKDSWEEQFRQWKDSKPKGPEALSLDISFPGAQHIYGLAEHASPLSLPDTTGPKQHYNDPYRLYNVDIFEYLADSPMALYGAIPLLHAHSASHSVGVLNLVASDTFVDVEHKAEGVATHWMSESGILDVLLLSGPRPQQLFEQYAILTGPTPLPPQWSTAYHQCRWNYIDEADVLAVQKGFDEVDIPLDVTWLDIEYAEEHRYFDWDKKYFPDPVKMQEEVASKGRKMVAIVDPHIKKTDSFRIYSDALSLDILIKKATGAVFEGWCWTGSSVWVDFFNPKSWDWWTRMFTFGVWKDSTKWLFIWNDMNEPSVFDGPEISVPRDTVHHGGWENRDVHNINGMLFHNQTAQALIARETPAQRPFVLSRSFFAGSHRFGAIWTGDNLGTWDHFAGETAMILSNNIAGMSFCGADVGGFFGNPSHELLVRWYQAGAFMPFFRAHAHIDTKRREPYLYDEPIRGYIRDAVRLRYQLLAVWYNAFHDASVTGVPIIKPQYAVFPQDEAGFAIDDQYYIGDSGLLFKPVTTEGAETSQVYISDNQPYYDFTTDAMYPASPTPRNLTLSTPLSTFPLLIQGGNILPIRQRVRRSSPLMWQDPYSLTIALDKNYKAKGQLYSDDGVGYGYEQGQYVWRDYQFSWTGKGKQAMGTLKSTRKLAGQSSASKGQEELTKEENEWAQKIAHVEVDQIVILGVPTEKPIRGALVRVGKNELLHGVVHMQGLEAASKEEGQAGVVVLKLPKVKVVDEWEIEFF